MSSGRVENSATFLEQGLSDVENDVSKVYGAIANTAQIVSRQSAISGGDNEEFQSFRRKTVRAQIFSQTNHFRKHSLIQAGSDGLHPKSRRPHLVGIVREAIPFLSRWIRLTDRRISLPTIPSEVFLAFGEGKLPKKGRDLVASAFITYGPTLTITFSCSGRVDQVRRIARG